jgi:UDP-N-acetylmuramoyl-tripeptide--D-alanyl-D-alanine ligase
MLALVLSAVAGEGAVLATSGNLNNHIGVPLMLLRLRERHRYAAIEMGMNHLGEIGYLARLARPDVALVTNAGVAHLGEVGSRQAIARAKGEIFGALGATGVAVINADDEYASYWRQLNRDRRIVDFGIDRVAAVSARFELSSAGSLVSVRAPDAQYVVRLQVPGLHNVRNALAAAACAHAVGVAPPEIAAGLARYAGTKGRLQRMGARGGATLIDDTYNANPDSVKAAIAVLAAAPGERVLVLGDMGELGQEGAALHAQTGEEARRAGVDHLLTLGELSEAAARAFGSGAKHFRELDALATALDGLLSADTTVLVKGSRFMRMERVVQHLINGEPQPAVGGH